MKASEYKLITMTREERQFEEQEFEHLRMQLGQKLQFQVSPADKFQKLIKEGYVGQHLDQQMEQYRQYVDARRSMQASSMDRQTQKSSVSSISGKTSIDSSVSSKSKF